MNIAWWAIAATLAASVLFTWIGAAGLVIARGALAKLHFTALCGSIGIPLGCVAVMIQHSFSQATTKSVFVAVFSIFTNAVLTHATGRAVCVSEKGDWRMTQDERDAKLEI